MGAPGRTKAVCERRTRTSTPDLVEIMESCGGSRAMERDRSMARLRILLKDRGPGSKEWDSASEWLIGTLGSGQASWEASLGTLSAAAHVLQAASRSRAPPPDAFLTASFASARALLEHEEPRVRAAVAELTSALAEATGSRAWDELGADILASIDRNGARKDGPDDRGGGDVGRERVPPVGAGDGRGGWRDRGRDGEEGGSSCGDEGVAAPGAADSPATAGNPRGSAAAVPADRRSPPERASNPLLVHLLTRSYRVERPGQGEMRHGTEGWGALETSARALAALCSGSAEAARAAARAGVSAAAGALAAHPNRYAREAAQQTMAAIASALTREELAKLAESLPPRMSLGMGDVWNNVRLAAVRAAWKTLAVVGVEGWEDEVRTGNQQEDEAGASSGEPAETPPSVVTVSQFAKVLLPPLILNRHNADAPGVRDLAREAWRALVGGRGRQVLGALAPLAVRCDLDATRSTNHGVREAACGAMGELAAGVGGDAVRPYAPAMMRASLALSRDAAWPVRDAAVLAGGVVAEAFPEVALLSLPKLLAAWVTALGDPVPCVREAGGISLARACGSVTLAGRARRAVAAHLDAKMGSAVAEEARGRASRTSDGGEGRGEVGGSASETVLDRASGTRGVVDPNFTWGALSPALARGADCCLDHGTAKPAEPWEESEACVRLVKELVERRAEEWESRLEAMVELVMVDAQFCPGADALRATVWEVLPDVCDSLGIRAFKTRHLDAFLGPLLRDLGCGAPLTEAAAGRCVGKLRDAIGPRIWAGRLSDEQQRLQDASPDVPAVSGRWAGAGVLPLGTPTAMDLRAGLPFPYAPSTFPRPLAASATPASALTPTPFPGHVPAPLLPGGGPGVTVLSAPPAAKAWQPVAGAP